MFTNKGEICCPKIKIAKAPLVATKDEMCEKFELLDGLKAGIATTILEWKVCWQNTYSLQFVFSER